jgi:hypothetical protein
MRRLTLAVIILALGLARDAAAAQEIAVAVLGVEAADAPEGMSDVIATALENRVRDTAGFKLVPGKDLDEIKLVFGCVDEQPTCMAKVGKSLGADKLIWGSVKKTSAGYNLTIKWLDVIMARVEKFVSENIGARPLDQAGANRAIARLTRSFLVSPFGVIKITSKVSGAQVMLGPRVIGLTSEGTVVLRDVPAGTHLIRIAKEGHRPWTQQVVVRGGETSELEAELEQIASEEELIPTPPPTVVTTVKKSSRKGWKIAFWTGAATTVALAGTMGYLGYTVLNLAEDKEEAILKYQTSHPNQPKAFASDDACAETDSYPDATQVKNICDKGSTRALLTNILIGGTLAVAALSGYFYYKAYLAEEPDASSTVDDEGDVAASAPIRWRLSPSAGVDGAGLDFTLNF